MSKITKLKVELELIDDGMYLATMNASNDQGGKHHNLGKVCRTMEDALQYINEESATVSKKLMDMTGTLPLKDGEEEEGEKEKDKKKGKKDE